MKIVICYPTINGYMASCWRALSRRPEIDLFVIAHLPRSSDLVDYGRNTMTGIPSYLLADARSRDAGFVSQLVEEHRPDLLVISGWSEPAYRALYFNKRLATTPKILVMDNQLRGTLRQHVGRVALRPLLGRVACAWVLGERSWRYARFLGFPEAQIRRGAVGVDCETLRLAFAERQGLANWPRRFLFVGRYHPRKALDVLANAYAQYRRSIPDPWPLTIAGKGPENRHFAGIAGVTDTGFVPPESMLDVWTAGGVFVQPSRYDAWPLSIVEAAAAGLPVIATEECGSAVEVVRGHYNGIVVPTEDPDALTRALVWAHQHYERLPAMGARSVQLASSYGADVWADRAMELVGAFGSVRAGEPVRTK